ncbi:DUF4231 domain-containing protein [Streptomyces goshikiensis]|uniref:DUF4231 domain-containing protein n=1 Tax=Streptomyces goshikiensis TaxID=1942 RepID=UPI0036F7AC55
MGHPVVLDLSRSTGFLCGAIGQRTILAPKIVAEAGAKLTIHTQATSPSELRAMIWRLQKQVREAEEDLAWKKRRGIRFGIALALTLLSIPGLVAWSSFHAKDHSLLMSGRAVLILVLVVSAVVVIGTLLIHLQRRTEFVDHVEQPGPSRYSKSGTELREELRDNRDALRRLNTLAPTPLRERRSLYREELTEVVAQYQREGRKYRRVHNALQSLVMIGSTTMTTLAALEAKEWNWLTISVISLGFSVTLASAFTGYYKYRERSYFLRQTSDAIEEEMNALTLGVGEYARFGQDDADQAMALFTSRVEALRNEQRRREQQLDQPADQAAPLSVPPV